MKLKAFKAAFPFTLPILTGFWFLGLAYGIYMNISGFPFTYPLIMSMVIFGGSLEFVAVEMLLSPFAPAAALTMAVLIQARHLFYGISMLDKFKGMGIKKFYLIFGLCDETFSINYTADIPEDVDKGWFMFFVTILNQIYWVSAATTGGIIGSYLPFDTEGLSFVMTAMFVVIFIEQWWKDKHHAAAFIGLAAPIICIMIFSPDAFMIPTMIVVVALLTLLRRPFEAAEQHDIAATQRYTTIDTPDIASDRTNAEEVTL